jgi:hypothetical protein
LFENISRKEQHGAGLNQSVVLAFAAWSGWLTAGRAAKFI